ADDVTLAGNGTMHVDTIPVFFGAQSGPLRTLTNGPSHTISGKMRLGDASTAVVNHGTIAANVLSSSLIIAAPSLLKDGTLLASNRATLQLSKPISGPVPVYENAGAIQAGTSSGVTVSVGVMGNGSWTADGGTIQLNGSNTVSSGGTISI